MAQRQEGLNERAEEEAGSLKALEDLVVDDNALTHLEAWAAPFNVFEAIGAVRQEVRHSSFLAFLCDPRQNHGLSDSFAKQLLQEAVKAYGAGSSPLSRIDLDLCDLDAMEVRSEWQDIDVLLLDESNKIVAIIENKIDSAEHSNQLEQYFNSIEAQYPDWRLLGIYLTPEGDTPTDERYVALSYRTVLGVVERVARSRASALGADVLTLITHYAVALRRHIVGDPELAELCRKIYQRHKRALDLIFEYRPDRQEQVKQFLVELIASTPGLSFDHASKSYVRFSLSAWDQFPCLKQGSGWDGTDRMLLFQFRNDPKSLQLSLVLGPGAEVVRTTLFHRILAKGQPFKPPTKTLFKKWNTVLSLPFPNPQLFDELEDLEASVRKQWDLVVRHTFPGIESAVHEIACEIPLPVRGESLLNIPG